jgi:FtsP/CotA-like multicopper oxidase with cupredoxin domain
MNGQAPDGNWTGIFKPGEKIRLRFINGSAMTYFDVRIPGLKMTVVAADGQHVKPVAVDEFRIAVAETYDVIVEPEDEQAYTIFAQSMDRTGYSRGTLAVREGMQAAVPAVDPRPLISMSDMGMDHGSMAGMDHGRWLGWTKAAWLAWTTAKWLGWTTAAWPVWTTAKWLGWTKAAWPVWTTARWLGWIKAAWPVWTTKWLGWTKAAWPAWTTARWLGWTKAAWPAWTTARWLAWTRQHGRHGRRHAVSPSLRNQQPLGRHADYESNAKAERSGNRPAQQWTSSADLCGSAEHLHRS